MAMEVTRQVFESITWCASIYSTGGGRPREAQLKLFDEKLSDAKLKIVQIEELEDDAYVCTTYGVGPATKVYYDPTLAMQKGFQSLSERIGKSFSAIFAGETNIESTVFNAAKLVGVPVLDADCTGGRAVPEIPLNNFFVLHKSIFPMVATSLDGKSSTIESVPDLMQIDSTIRKLATSAPMERVIVVDRPIQVKDAKQVLTTGTIMRSYKTGVFAAQVKNDSDKVAKLAQQMGAKLLIDGTLTKVEVAKDEKEGFLKGFYYVEDKQGNTAKIYVKNENIACWLNDKLAVSPPNPIMTIDFESLLGVHNGTLDEQKGRQVFVLTKDAVPLWQSAEGLKLFDLAHFGVQ